MSWKPGQKDAFHRELDAARTSQKGGDSKSEFIHLERAHVLGQRNTWAHTFAHWRMFRYGLRRNDIREVIGQVARMLAALTKSKIWVPVGNTGGANVSPFRPMAVPEDLRRYVD